MRTFLEILLIVVLAALSIWAGLPWPIVFVVAVLLACGFRVFSFSRGDRVDPGLFFALAAFVGLGLFISWLLSYTVFSAFRSDFPGAGASTTLWSLVLGFMLTAVFYIPLLLPLSFIGARMIYGGFDGYKGHELTAMYSLISGIFQISKGTMLVRDGKVQVTDGQEKSLRLFGGPGRLIIQEGHAVILEVAGKVPRVVGAGLTWLRPFEKVSMVVPLSTRTEHLVVQKIRTNDKMAIEEFEIWVFHKPDLGSEGEVKGDSAYPYNETVIIDKIWGPAGNDWRNGVQSVSETALRDLVGHYKLEDLVPLTDAFRGEFREQLADKINKVTRRVMGVQVTSVDVGKIVIPPEAEARLLERQLAKWEQGINATRAETERRVQVARANARMETIAAVSQGIRQLLGSTKLNPQELILLRFIEYLEQRAQTSAATGEDEAATLLKLRSFEALGMFDLRASGHDKSEGVEEHGNSGSGQ